MFQITDKIYFNLGQNCGNSGAVIGKKEVLVIDTTFFPKDAQILRDEIKKITPLPIKALFNTHHHADHTFGNQVFEGEIIAHKSCLEIMRQRVKDVWSKEAMEKELKQNPSWKEEFENLKITFPNKTFEDELELDLGKLKVKLIHLGGHTEDSSVAFIPQEKVLFSGDLIFQGCFPFMMHAHTKKWISALEKILSWGVKIVIPGHGMLCDKNEVKRHLDYLIELREKCQNAMDQGYSLDETFKSMKRESLDEKTQKRYEDNIRKVYEELSL
jgi:cyclase